MPAGVDRRPGGGLDGGGIAAAPTAVAMCGPLHQVRRPGARRGRRLRRAPTRLRGGSGIQRALPPGRARVRVRRRRVRVPPGRCQLRRDDTSRTLRDDHEQWIAERYPYYHAWVPANEDGDDAARRRDGHRASCTYGADGRVRRDRPRTVSGGDAADRRRGRPGPRSTSQSWSS